jgi:lysophospholipase L1-like esterase
MLRLWLFLALSLAPALSWSIENGRYKIVASSSGLNIDVSGASTADGATIVQYPARSGLNQQFDVAALGDGSYSIRPAHSGKSFDVFNRNPNDGAELRQWTYSGGSNQRWRIDSVGSGVYSITSVFSSRVVEVWQASTAAGAALRLNTYVGVANQKWSFIKVGATSSVPVSVFIAGDSIVSTYVDTASPNDQAGWGQMLPALYDAQVTVFNHAIGGRTARRFIDEGRLTAIWNAAKAGDYLLVQFGTNDANRTATYTINGQTIPYFLEPGTDFKLYLSQYISGARSRNIKLVFVTPTPRSSAYCTGSNGTAAWAQAMRELAAAEGIPLVDLNQKTVNYLKAICPAPNPENFFLRRADGTVDGTHFQENGARILARFVADGIGEAAVPLNSHRK